MVIVAGELAVTLGSLLEEIVLVLYGPFDELGVTVANALGVVTHPVRKKALTLLTEQPVRTRFEIAEAAASDDDVPYESIDRLELLLHHDHLPRLADHQYLEYDTRHGDVVLWEDPETIKSVLEPR
jgi:hypothetical protein